MVLLAATREQAWQWANDISPEHITVDAANADRISNAGSVFLGNHSPQALGDYCAGPNHVLPTAGGARTRGGLSVNDFLKVITVQRATRAGLKKLGPTATSLADAEGLKAHAASVRVSCAHA